MGAAGRVVTKDELVAAVWPDVIVNDDALAQCVRDIRKALGDEDQRFIKTVPKRGYLFAGEMEHESSRPLPDPAIIPRRRTPVAALAALLFAAAILAALAWSHLSGDGSIAAVRDPRPSVAVLPFRTSTENDVGDWLGEGVAEDVIMALSRFRDIAVIARNSNFGYGTEHDLAGIRDKLRADFLLQGSLRRRGDELRLAVQLVDLETGVNRWAEYFDRPWGDVFAIQDSIARDVAGQLAAQTRNAAVVRSQGRPTAVLDAYDRVLRGRKAYLTFTREGAVEGLDLARRAVASDPAYAVGWELLKQILMQFHIQPYDERRGDPAVVSEAGAAAARAVQLDPDYSTARATLGAMIARGGDFGAGLAELREALRLNPNDASTLGIYADTLARAGLHAESLAALNELARLDPVGTALVAALKARAEFFTGDHQAALASARKCAAVAPKLQACLLMLTISASAAGEPEEAASAARRLIDLNPTFGIGRHFTIIPFRNPADVDAMAVHLRAAGLPD
jgi:TolB-like protein